MRGDNSPTLPTEVTPMKRILVDTNLLLDGFTINDEHKYILLSHVNRELDKHKVHGDSELKFKSRRAVRFIEENEDNFEYDVKDYSVSFDESFDNNYTDNKIIQACIDNGYSLTTNDLLLKQKAKMYKIDLVESKGDFSNKSYVGYKEISPNDEELASLYENLRKNTYDLLVNEFLIIKDKYGFVADKFRWNGSEHVKLKHSPTKKIRSMNVLQDCAIDILLNKDIPIKIIAGNYGSGKTILSVKTALYNVLDKGVYSKIMMVRNPIGSGKEIGFLSGGKAEKTEGFFKPFIQHLEGGDQEAFFLEQRGVLSKEIPFYMKGLSIEDTIIICDEAEDLDVKLIRLIGTRLSKDSAVIFAGDYNQTENEYKNNNGLMRAIDKLKGNPLVGIVVLEEDVRSDASKVFACLE